MLPTQLSEAQTMKKPLLGGSFNPETGNHIGETRCNVSSLSSKK